MPRVVSVGRLDLTTEGLLLLTNDGALSRFLELPATGWPRRYRVRVHGEPSAERLLTLARGITIEGVEYGPIEAEIDRQVGSNCWLNVALREGKNREVRKVMEFLGLSVTRLIRVSYGPMQLGKLARGAVEEVPRHVLLDQCSRYFSEAGITLPPVEPVSTLTQKTASGVQVTKAKLPSRKPKPMQNRPQLHEAVREKKEPEGRKKIAGRMTLDNAGKGGKPTLTGRKNADRRR
jgi:23S rRNA pseudouridine2605 synthase